MEKHLFTEEEAIAMASKLSDNLYYEDQFSKASFAVFCQNLPKPSIVDIFHNGVNFLSTSIFARITTGDLRSFLIVFDDPSNFSWFKNRYLADAGFSEPSTFSYYFRYSNSF